jgi:hypothetical protein
VVPHYYVNFYVLTAMHIEPQIAFNKRWCRLGSFSSNFLGKQETTLINKYSLCILIIIIVDFLDMFDLSYLFNFNKTYILLWFVLLLKKVKF